MRRFVRVLTRAQQDVAACYAYIAERSPQGAASWFNRFTETRDRLAVDAEKRVIATESAYVDYEIREVLFKTRKGKPYRLLFTILDKEVLVLRIRGPGQDYVPENEFPVSPDSD